MELRHLRYFIAVALEENVTRAAEKLHVSQPALSRQVRDLEEELGFALLERSAKSVSLTEAGRVFLDEASAVLERLEEGIETAAKVARGESGEIHVGYAPSLTVRILPPTIRAFQAVYPKVKVKLHDATSEEMLEGLRKGKLDFAFMLEDKVRPVGDLRFEPLRQEAIRLAVGLHHKLAALETIEIRNLKGEQFIGYALDEYPEYGELLDRVLAESGRRGALDEEHESVSSLIAALESGSGVSLVTESLRCVSGERLRLLEIEPVPEALTVGIAWKRRELGVKEAVFLEKAQEACRLVEL